MSFLQLIQQVTNGSQAEINYTGTEIVFRPGVIYGGEVDFLCNGDRSIVYYLEPLLLLAPFSKNIFKLTLRGLTCDSIDHSIDFVKNGALRILKCFGVSEGLDFKIVQRAFPPTNQSSQGIIQLTCPIVNALKAIQMTEVGKVRRIRGIVATCRVSPKLGTRMIESSRSVLDPLVSDVYIYSDISAKGESRTDISPGYSLYLQADTTGEAFYFADQVGLSGVTPEDMVKDVVKELLRQVRDGGITNKSLHWMIVILMALCPENVSKVDLGSVSQSTSDLMSEIKNFLGVNYKIKEGIVSCVGSGLVNLNRKTQ